VVGLKKKNRPNHIDKEVGQNEQMSGKLFVTFRTLF